MSRVSRPTRHNIGHFGGGLFRETVTPLIIIIIIIIIIRDLYSAIIPLGGYRGANALMSQCPAKSNTDIMVDWALFVLVVLYFLFY